MRSVILILSASLLGCLACGGGGGGAPQTPAPAPSNVVTAILPYPVSPLGGSYWVAYQDGQGPWTVAAGQVGGATTTYTFRVEDPAGRYGLAMVAEYPGGGTSKASYGMLEHFTLAEVRTLDYSLWAPTAKVNAYASVVGVSSTEGARLSTGGTIKDLNPGTTGAMLSATPGATDFLAARMPGMGPADKVVALHGAQVSATAPVSLTFDFNSGWTLEPQSMTASGVSPAESLALQVDWVIPSTTLPLASGTASPLAFNAVPTQRLQTGELHALTATAHDAAALSYRTAQALSLAAAGVNLPLPSACPPPSFAPAGAGPTYRPSLTWTALPGALVQDLTIGDAYALLDWEVHLSAGWLGNGSSLAYAFPDFSGLSGWQAAWGLPFGRDLYWNLGQRQSTYVDPGFLFLGPRTYKAGATAWASMSYGGLNVTPGTAPTGTRVKSVASPRSVPSPSRGVVSVYVCR